MKLREYAQADKEACLAIFDSNTPPFFAPHEREEFARFLETSSDPYFVVEHDGEVVGCGGILLIPNTPVAILTWGMVARARHRAGIGRRLLVERLHRLCQLPGCASSSCRPASTPTASSRRRAFGRRACGRTGTARAYTSTTWG